MQQVEVNRVVAVEAEGGSPASPAQLIRWSTVLSAAVTLLSIALLIWLLALAIISLAAQPTVPSMRGAGLAVWITAMVATIVGGLVGGWVAGRSAGGSRRAGAMHAFVAWGLSFLVAFTLQLFVLRSVATAAVVQHMAKDEIAAASRARTARNLLTPRDFLAAPSAVATPHEAALAEPAFPALDTIESFNPQTMHDFSIATTWSWFATWLLAGIAAAIAGAAAADPVGRASKRTPMTTTPPEPNLFGARPHTSTP